MNYAIKIEQKAIGEDPNGDDFTLELQGKVVDVQVECLDDSGYNCIVGWNEQANKDILIPGKGKGYGVPERGFLDGNSLAINFALTGTGSKLALVTIWRQGEEIC